jgi:hypothetical protein
MRAAAPRAAGFFATGVAGTQLGGTKCVARRRGAWVGLQALPASNLPFGQKLLDGVARA